MEGAAAQRKGIGCDGDTLKTPVVDGGTVSKPPLPSPLEEITLQTHGLDKYKRIRGAWSCPNPHRLRRNAGLTILKESAGV